MPGNVFPTPVGVNLNAVINGEAGVCFPHTCGGEPRMPAFNARVDEFSPHLWG